MLQDDSSREEEPLGDGDMSLSQWVGDKISYTLDDMTEIVNQLLAFCPPAQLPIYPLSIPPTVVDYRDPSCSPSLHNGPLYSLLTGRWLSSEGEVSSDDRNEKDEQKREDEEERRGLGGTKRNRRNVEEQEERRGTGGT
ncbi:hypothetical protein ACOMHN_004268 [Nucella lapillus]